MLRVIIIMGLIFLNGYKAFSQDTIRIEVNKANYEIALADNMYESVSITLYNMGIEETLYAVYSEYMNNREFYDNIPEEYVYARNQQNELEIKCISKHNTNVVILEELLE